MSKAKVVVHGHWIYDHDTGWKLAVYPIVTMVPAGGEPPFYQSFVLAKECNMDMLGKPCDAIEKVFNSKAGDIKSLTLYNLGNFHDDEHGEELEFFLICAQANIKDGITHPVITDEGYMYVEDLGIGENPEEDEPLDNAIYEALSRLEAPHTITCN